MSLKLTVATIKKIAAAHSWEVTAEPMYGYVGVIRFPNGNETYFRSNSFEVNTTAALRIAKDKDYAKLFLRRAGIRVPEGKAFYSERYNQHMPIKVTVDDGYAFVEKIGFPVILKPNSKSQGTGVYKVHSKEDFYTVATELLRHHSIILVEQVAIGRDYRVTVYKDKVFAVYERQPLTITGDGEHTIGELLDMLSETVRKNKDIPVPPDYAHHKRVWHTLTQAGYAKTDVLQKGKIVPIFDNSNLSAGGFAVDWTDQIHPTFYDLAIRAVKASHLELSGVDFITPDITKPATNDNYVVVEVNGNPGIENFMRMGKTQYQRAYDLYETLLLDQSKK